MDTIEKVEEKLENVERKINDNTLATLVINKLIKIIICLISVILIETVAWIVYISLPVEETEVIQEADTQGDSSPISQEIGD